MLSIIESSFALVAWEFPDKVLDKCGPHEQMELRQCGKNNLDRVLTVRNFSRTAYMRTKCSM